MTLLYGLKLNFDNSFFSAENVRSLLAKRVNYHHTFKDVATLVKTHTQKTSKFYNIPDRIASSIYMSFVGS